MIFIKVIALARTSSDSLLNHSQVKVSSFYGAKKVGSSYEGPVKHVEAANCMSRHCICQMHNSKCIFASEDMGTACFFLLLI